jgi:hypothetical protein
MTRKLSLLLILLVSLFVTTPVLAAKSYQAERFDVQIDLQENGSAIVTETVEFRFEGDPFTFVFREVQADETDGVTFIEASMDGVPMSQGTEAGQVEVEAGDPLEVTWHFSPTTGATHVFVVRYRVDGVVRKGDADSIIWRAVPEDHDYSIARSTVTLTYPPGATLLEEPTLNRDSESVETDGSVRLTTGGLGKDEQLILTARFAPNSLTQLKPRWQARGEQLDAAAARAVPVSLAAGVVTLLLGSLGLFAYARANARELNTSPSLPYPNPPSDVPPAVIGKLAGKPHGFMGTIFDLAQRGVLEINEEQGLLGTKKHVLIRKQTDASLRPHEQGLLDAIFKSGETELKMSEVATRLAGRNTLFDEPLEQELIERGWLDTQRKVKQTTLVATGLIALFAALAVFIASLVGMRIIPGDLVLVTLLAALAGIGVSVFLLSIALLIYTATFSILTPAGEEQLARWNGFAEYLGEVSKGKQPAIRPDYFERYLAYAAVFGLGKKWAEYFQTLGGVPLPVWFHASAGSNADFGAVVVVMSASDSAGAGSGGGGGAGAGASGGGSSGAG